MCTKNLTATIAPTATTTLERGTHESSCGVETSRRKIMMYLFFWIVMEFALVIGAVQLILKKGEF